MKTQMDTQPSPCPAEFFSSYVFAAIWASTDDEGAPLDANYGCDDLAPSSLAQMRADCDAFYAANYDDLNCEGVSSGPDFRQDGRAGHDFWLTRNRRGAGFWDGDWPEPQATRLTNAARAAGECDLYVGDDGLIYLA